MSTETSSISPTPTKDDDQNEQTIRKLYEALSEGDMRAVARLTAAEELEYWFHGPPKCHHMMRALTGAGAGAGEAPSFRFAPRSVTAVGGACVVAEGWEGAKAYWVHVWTVGEGGGVVVGLREYFNTWLTVRDVRPGWDHRHVGATLVWQSMPRDLFRRSLPGLVLAI